jgi:hypothetical protein
MTEDAYSLYWSPDDFVDPWCDDMSKAPDALHIRGMWVYSSDSGERIYFDAVVGFVDDDGDFIMPCGDPCGWRAEDFEYWMPLPKPPRAK